MSIRSFLLGLACMLHPVSSGAIDPRNSNATTPTEVPYIREYFYAGGRYVDDGTGTGEHIFKEQMYVEQLTPLAGSTRKFPLVFMHGAGQTGTNWLNKPDGGRGWASLFVSQGYEVYIVDVPFRGRSPWQPNNGTLNVTSAEWVEQHFTAVQDFNIWPQAKFHTQWNGTGLRGDPVFDAFYATQIQGINEVVYQQSSTQTAGVALLDRIGKPAILIGHSMGGPYPLLIADKRPQLVRAIFDIEPAGPPFQDAVFDTTPARAWGVTDSPITYEPPVEDPATDLVRQTHSAPAPDLTSCILQADSPTPKKLVNLVNIPMVAMTTQASYHAVYDYCTVAYWKQAGIKDVTHLKLEDVGITGNAHMVFLEKNSDTVQALVEQHISSWQ